MATAARGTFGVTDTAVDKPKWLSAAQKANTYYVSSEEAELKTNKDRGIRGPGWYLINEKVDADGNTSQDTECLVAFKYLTALTATAGDNDGGVIANTEFSFATQPSNVTVQAPAGATFSVVVSAPAGATYQWQQKTGTAAYTNVTNAGVYTGATTGTLAISASTGLDGVSYRCIVTAATSAAIITSKKATLTVTPA